jgi:hypothetical protein
MNHHLSNNEIFFIMSGDLLGVTGDDWDGYNHSRRREMYGLQHLRDDMSGECLRNATNRRIGEVIPRQRRPMHYMPRLRGSMSSQRHPSDRVGTASHILRSPFFILFAFVS